MIKAGDIVRRSDGTGPMMFVLYTGRTIEGVSHAYCRWTQNRDSFLVSELALVPIHKPDDNVATGVSKTDIWYKGVVVAYKGQEVAIEYSRPTVWNILVEGEDGETEHVPVDEYDLTNKTEERCWVVKDLAGYLNTDGMVVGFHKCARFDSISEARQCFDAGRCFQIIPVIAKVGALEKR